MTKLPPDNQCPGVSFSISSFRGCTRVAALDAKLWTQLFSLNSPALVDCLDELIGHLQSYRETIAAGDREALLGKLTVSCWGSQYPYFLP